MKIIAGVPGEEEKMKMMKHIVACLAAAFLFASCASGKNVSAEDEKRSIYDYAQDGVFESYKDYDAKRGYSIIGPFAPGSIGRKPNPGEKSQYSVLFDDKKSAIQYLDDNGNVSIEKIVIAKNDDGLFLSKYIGKSKAEFLNDFPMEFDKNDVAFGFGGLLYDSEKDGKIRLQVTAENGALTHIVIIFRSEEDAKKYRERIEAMRQTR